MEHDASYKLLFSHARMVEDLLRGFVHEAWVRDVDFTTLERVSDSQISDDLRSRRDDLVWRVRWGLTGSISICCWNSNPLWTPIWQCVFWSTWAYCIRR